ncbi:MAG: alpha/beta hydrolase [Chloroherpetonaceae bacterium]|nr:alpha/beta hydrolase [Chloroherpetonaceae bacterium]
MNAISQQTTSASATRLATEKFRIYESEIQQRLQSKKARERHYAEYELSLIQKSHFVSLNGTLHHYYDSNPDASPDAPTVILIHGWDCWWMWWHKVIGFLVRKNIRAIAYDLKGHGWSDEDVRNDYSLQSLSKDLHALVEHLGLKRYHIAAFSLGPFVALDYAMKNESEIQSLTFFNFGYFPNNPTISKIIPKAIPFLFDKIVRRLTWWPALYAYARVTLARNPATKEDILVGMNSLRFCSSNAIKQTAEQLSKIEVTENLPKQVAALNVSMLFVAGKGDQVVSWKNAKKLCGYARKGRFELIKKCGHLITLELPEKTAEIIAGHINAYQTEYHR